MCQGSSERGAGLAVQWGPLRDGVLGLSPGLTAMLGLEVKLQAPVSNWTDVGLEVCIIAHASQ